MEEARSSLYAEEIDFATLGELTAAARERLAPEVWDFLESGAGEEQTLRANRLAFERRSFVPRVMTGAGAPRTETEFLGMRLAVPFLTAPFGGDGLFAAEGHLATARANLNSGAGMIVPEASSHSLAAIAAAAPALPRLFQLHPIEPVERFLRLAAEARAAGYTGLCVTVDCPVAGWRERNMGNRFAPDLANFAGNFDGDGDVGVAEMFTHLMSPDHPTWTWERLGEVCAETGMPWMAKGILDPDDARRAVDVGAAAVLVSNHGGRQLDGAIASLDALPAVVAAVGDSVGVAFDSGIRRGSDVAKALALGADVVVLGRLAAHALCAAGQEGVERMHELLLAELRTIMMLCGCARVAELRSRVRPDR
ncbi:MAG: alpha-hydroxy acid oxidase [Solirubrobacterales bacterium]